MGRERESVCERGKKFRHFSVCTTMYYELVPSPDAILFFVIFNNPV